MEFADLAAGAHAPQAKALYLPQVEQYIYGTSVD
jgi:hypothetical protein